MQYVVDFLVFGHIVITHGVAFLGHGWASPPLLAMIT
jgi:hypothetical protein